MPHPNTVAHSAAAVCCSDETSARRHRDRATWHDQGFIATQRRIDDTYLVDYAPPERRWTR